MTTGQEPIRIGMQPPPFVLAASDRVLAERFARIRPPIRGPFDRLEVAESPWGPLLGGSRPHAACRLSGAVPVGYAELVEGVIEQLELHDLEDPLAYLSARRPQCNKADRATILEPAGVRSRSRDN